MPGPRELGRARKGHRHPRAAGGQAAPDTEDARGRPGGRTDPPNLGVSKAVSSSPSSSSRGQSSPHTPPGWGAAARSAGWPHHRPRCPSPHRRVPARGQRWGWAGCLLEFCSAVARQWRRRTPLRRGAAGPNANQGRRSSPSPTLPLPAPPRLRPCSHPGAEERRRKAPALSRQG